VNDPKPPKLHLHSPSQPPDFLSDFVLLKTRGQRSVLAHHHFCVVFFYSVLFVGVSPQPISYIFRYFFFCFHCKTDPHIFGKPIRINPSRRPTPLLAMLVCPLSPSPSVPFSLPSLVLYYLSSLALRLPFAFRTNTQINTTQFCIVLSLSYALPFYPSYMRYLITPASYPTAAVVVFLPCVSLQPRPRHPPLAAAFFFPLSHLPFPLFFDRFSTLARRRFVRILRILKS